MARHGEPPPDWARYDDVAAAYDRLIGLNGYARLAEDMIALLDLPRGSRALDAGCGTGAATLAARDAAGEGGMGVGLDMSLPMLRRAWARGARWLVSGMLPALPFRDRTFDGVAASLVLSHLEQYREALAEMVRVLRPGGRLGVTAYAADQPHPAGRPSAFRRWQETAAASVGEDALRDAKGTVAPCEEWFTDPAHLVEALADAGLERVEVHQRAYRVAMDTDHYLEMIAMFACGRFVRRTLGPARWREFSARAAAAVRGLCGDEVEYTSRYHVAIGRCPARILG